MLTDHYLLEDRAARALSDATATQHELFKAALRQPVRVPAGFTAPIQLIAEARAALTADRARAGVVLPFEKKAAPSPRPAPQPFLPLRPAASATIAKLSVALDRKHKPSSIGDYFREVVGKAVMR